MPIRWRKSSRSGQESSCVELSHTGDKVRDSKNTTGPILKFDPSRLGEFVESVKVGRFDG